MKHLPLNTIEFERLYKEFYKAIKAQGYNRDKEPTLAYPVREFLFFLETKNISEITQVKASDVISYYEYLRERPNQRREGGLSDSMIQKHLYALRLFFDYLVETKQLSSSPAHLPKFSAFKHNDRQPLSVSEIKLLYKSCTTKQEKAILALAYGCGLRRSEIEQLNVNDIQFHQGALTVRKGKFGKTRTVPVSNTVLKDLKEYLIYERAKLLSQLNKTSSAFLLNKEGNRMQGQTIYDCFKEMTDKTNNASLMRKNVSLHHLRHSIATHLLDNGASMEFVQKFLGHVMLDTTHIYSKRRKRRQLIKQAAEEVLKKQQQ